MRLDHLVILVPDLHLAITDYTELGFTVTPGGAHADGLTENALIAFTDGSYLELIAFNDPAKPQLHRWWRFVGLNGGLIDYALGCSALQSEIDMLAAKQLVFDGPHPNGRQRPDGTVLRWLGAFAPEGLGLPFLIEDLTPRDLRVPAGAATSHVNGVQGVGRVVVGVADLSETAKQYGLLLNELPTSPTHNANLAADAVDIPLGQVTLVLAHSTDHAGALDAQLKVRGPGIYSIALTVVGEQSTGWMDPRRTHGARIQLV